MYAGKIVEQAPVRELFNDPKHPYTRALLGSVPKLGQQGSAVLDPGQPPNPASLPPGCAFHPRCPEALPRCATRSAGSSTSATGASPGAGFWTMPSPVLEVRGLTKHFAVRQRLFGAARVGEGRRRRRLRHSSRRDAGPHR
jgi:oligopeptide/dipeptide ABC transporter ATP-binding protein